MSLPKKVLIVDDSKVSRMMCIGLLRKQIAGIPTIEAGNASDARALVESERPDWLILDHNMPGTTGLELAAELVPTYPHLRIALVTANIQEATQQRAATLGIHFFRKPINDSVLKELVATLSTEPAGAVS